MKSLPESWMGFLTEGIQDKAILKAVFMSGGAGSGKSTISSYILDYDKNQALNTMTQTGLKISNIDMPYALILKQIGIDPSTLGSLPEEEFNKINYGPDSPREKARKLTNLMLASYQNQRLGILVDGTGAIRDKITQYKTKFEQLGYDCLMIYVDVDLEVALQRNRDRKERSLRDSVVKDLWSSVRDNLKYYDQLYGDNFVYVNNNVTDIKNLKQAKRRVLDFLHEPVQNPIGQKWIQSKKKTFPKSNNWESSWKKYLKEQKSSQLELENYTLNTSNHNKFLEFVEYGLHGVHRTDVDLPEPNSDPVTVVAYKASSVPPKTIIEDTSLEVEGADIGVNVRWMLDRLENFVGKKAVITTLLAVLEEDGKVHIYKGELSGKIVNPAGNGFGFDSVFLPDGANKTLGEKKPKEITARYKAVQNFLTRNVFKLVDPVTEWNGEMQHT